MSVILVLVGREGKKTYGTTSNNVTEETRNGTNLNQPTMGMGRMVGTRCEIWC